MNEALSRAGMVRAFAWANNRRKVVASWLQRPPTSMASTTSLQRRVLDCCSGIAACSAAGFHQSGVNGELDASPERESVGDDFNSPVNEFDLQNMYT